jgi:hypothetical protein
MHPTFDETPTLTAKQRRKLERVMRAVREWLDNLPDEARRPFYPTHQIIAGTGIDPGALGPALRAAGWQYAQRRLPEKQGLPAAVWAPPDAPSPRRRPGRPAPTTKPATEAKA